MDFFSSFGGITLVMVQNLPLLGIVWGDHTYTLADIASTEILSSVLGVINTLIFVQLTAWGYDTIQDVLDRINCVMSGGGYVGRR